MADGDLARYQGALMNLLVGARCDGRRGQEPVTYPFRSASFVSVASRAAVAVSTM
jgi:hypothetical protein